MVDLNREGALCVCLNRSVIVDSITFLVVIMPVDGFIALPLSNGHMQDRGRRQ